MEGTSENPLMEGTSETPLMGSRVTPPWSFNCSVNSGSFVKIFDLLGTGMSWLNEFIIALLLYEYYKYPEKIKLFKNLSVAFSALTTVVIVIANCVRYTNFGLVGSDVANIGTAVVIFVLRLAERLKWTDSNFLIPLTGIGGFISAFLREKSYFIDCELGHGEIPLVLSTRHIHRQTFRWFERIGFQCEACVRGRPDVDPIENSHLEVVLQDLRNNIELDANQRIDSHQRDANGRIERHQQNCDNEKRTLLAAITALEVEKRTLLATKTALEVEKRTLLATITALEEKNKQMELNQAPIRKKTVSCIASSSSDVLEKAAVEVVWQEAMAPVVSMRKAMPVTTTRLINKIWAKFYSNYLSEDSNQKDTCEVKEDEEVQEEQEEDEEENLEEVEEEKSLIVEEIEKPQSALKQTKPSCSNNQIRWDGEAVGRTCHSEALYKHAIVPGGVVTVGGSVLVKTADSDKSHSIYFVEYMFENSAARKMVHGRVMLRGFQTVLGNTANEREVFLTNDCVDFELGDVIETVVVVVEDRSMAWGNNKIDRAEAEDRKTRGLPLEYFCKCLYWPEKGAFFCLQTNSMGLGTGICHSCKIKEMERENKALKVNSATGFIHNGTEYRVCDFVYLGPDRFAADEKDNETLKSGRNVGLKAYVVCQLLEIKLDKDAKKAHSETMGVVRRFFRPEDISAEKAYHSDIREVYYSEKFLEVPIIAIEGKCLVRRKQDLPPHPATFEHIFFCEHWFDHNNGAIKQLPDHIKLSPSKEWVVDNAVKRTKKGKMKEGEKGFDAVDRQEDASQTNRLATLDIFAGCGGFSEGIQQSGVSLTKWAIEHEEAAGKAFGLNHPEALTFINNCNVILRAIMTVCGDADKCISTSDAAELAAKLDEKEIANLPRRGQVDFINGGSPCQGFSGMNRFNQSTWSKVQCEMIPTFLSFADYFRPKFFLLENVRNFVSFNKGQAFRLTLASLLEMGYQVRFGILEAGAYGVSQSCERAFIWAASPKETLPEWPEPMHVFDGPELKVSLNGNTHYAAVRSTSNGAPFRAITVRDTIADLPSVRNGASASTMEYKDEPISWFQKKIRGDMPVLTDHISEEMNELNLIRCQRIPKKPGADWRDLPDEKVKLSTGQVVDLIPFKKLFGRLDWEGNFPTSVTDAQLMGKVGMCFHPEQDRILTVREFARSQGFADSYKFAGNIQHKHRQVGNAVPPPLAFALGRKLKEAVEGKRSA